MGSSGKRGQLPTSVVRDQHAHPKIGRLLGTYYTLNAIPLPRVKHNQKASLPVPRCYDTRTVTISPT